jgi:hypothetical protein
VIAVSVLLVFFFNPIFVCASPGTCRVTPGNQKAPPKSGACMLVFFIPFTALDAPQTHDHPTP